MNHLPRLGWIEFTTLRHRRPVDRRRTSNTLLSMEPLEDRTVLSTITWSTTAAPNGGNWDVGSNWQGGVVPGSSDTAIIKGLTSPGLVYMDMNKADSVAGLTTDSTTNLEVINGSLSLGVASSSTLGGSVTVESGAALKVGAAASVSVDSTLSDAGAVTFSSGDQVTVGWDEEIAVSGSLTANSTTFIDGGNTANITFASSGTLSGGGNSFNLPIYVSYTLVASLAGNASLDEVYIEAGTISSGTLSLKLIGNNTSMSYLFASGFTVGAGGTMAVGANVPVSVDSTLSDAGAVTFSSGDQVTVGCDEEIAVSGSLTANSTTSSMAATLPTSHSTRPGRSVAAATASTCRSTSPTPWSPRWRATPASMRFTSKRARSPAAPCRSS